ncbi:hypothetical protein C0585_03520 [Candidatus Woesearchaeota archaeon]|nr:MAG: hypothetical protein C0585_03520 [Candidatus Woesearchaeota archaeon]
MILTTFFTIYGNSHIDLASLTIESIKNQSIKSEILVVEVNEVRQVKNEGIEHVLIKPSKKLTPSLLKNIALKSIKTEYAYSTDADILFYERDYLEKIIELASEGVAIKPSLKRFPIQEKDKLIELSNKQDFNEILQSLKINKYVASLSGSNHDIIPHLTGKRQATTTIKEFNEYINHPSRRGREPFYFQLLYHAGAICCKTKLFKDVGGYFEGFINWGYEDKDLRLKLSKISPLIELKNDYEVIHVDHKRGYFCQDSFKRNTTLFDIRSKSDISNIIKEDKLKNGFN